MIKLAASRKMNSNLPKTGAALLFVSLAAACSTSDGASPTDGGAAADGAALPVAHTAADGAALPVTHTGSTAPVNLGMAGSYAILAKTGVATVPTSAITGDVGISPAAASYVTGFALAMDATNVFAISPQITGKVYASDYAPPTPSNLTTAVSDMQLAFTDAAGRAPDITELGAGNIGGMRLAAGVYKWGTGLTIPTSVTLNGSATDVWIFQIAQDLTVSSAVSVVLAGGAMAKNIFWQVAGAADLGTTAHFEGVLLSQTSVTLRTGASIKGRLFAQTAVNVDASAVVQPAP